MTRRRRGWGGGALVLAFLVGLLLYEGGEDGRETEEVARDASGEVVRVVDGDTIVVALGGEDETVRYIGVDTPETVKPGAPVDCFGPEASAINESLVEGRSVRLIFDRERRDHYGRLLAYVYAGGLFVNAELVQRGAARTLEIEPNTSKAEQLGRLEIEAGRSGAGLWSRC